MKGSREGLVMGGALAACAALFGAASVGLAPAARVVPLAVALPTFAILAADLVVASRRRVAPGVTPGEERARPPELAMSAWMLSLPLLIAGCGLVAGTAVFLCAYLRARSRQPWTSAVAAAGALALAFHLLLSVGLGLPVHDGLVRGWLAW